MYKKVLIIIAAVILAAAVIKITLSPGERSHPVDLKNSHTPDAASETLTSPPPTLVPTLMPPDMIDPAGLDNTLSNWYYMPAKTLWQEQQAKLDDKTRAFAEKYKAIWQGTANEKTIYITFSTGANCADNLNQIMDTAKEQNVPLNFIINGSIFKYMPEAIRRMAGENHMVINHAYDHMVITSYLDQHGEDAFWRQITDTEEEYRELTGQELPKLFSSPAGRYSDKVGALLSTKGYRQIFWSFAYRDYMDGETPEYRESLDKMLSELHPGMIMLLHPTCRTNVDVFPELIEKVRAQGYTIKSLRDYQ